jgi:uncharacterized protein (DUF169 family)
MSSKKINWKRIDETIRAYLGLKYHLVGVKIRKKPIQEEEKRLKPEKPLAYCHMVRIASLQGKTFLYDKTDEACPTAEFILGFREPKYSKIEHRIEPSDTKSILIAPLDRMDDDPDVIIATVTPKQMMDLTTILQAGKAELLSAWFRGEAACAEFTAKPYMEHKPNVSFLCNGARVVYSDFRDAEILFGASAHTYIHVAETMDRISKTGGALCGCRTSDIPMEIINEFEKVGFSKGTDYFFGKINGQNLRAYLNKDFQGRLKFVTFHLPVKLTSAEETEEAAKKLQKTLVRPYSVNKRGYWLDLTMTATEDELAIDLRDGESIKKVTQEFANKMKRILDKIGIKA